MIQVEGEDYMTKALYFVHAEYDESIRSPVLCYSEKRDFDDDRIEPSNILGEYDITKVDNVYQRYRGIWEYRDYRACDVGPKIVISNRLVRDLAKSTVNMFKDCHVRDIWYHRGYQPKKEQHFKLYCPRYRYYILDLLNAKVEYIENTDVVCHVNEWAVDWSAVPGWDFFPIEHSCDWCCTENMASFLIDGGYTGFTLKKIA